MTQPNQPPSYPGQPNQPHGQPGSNQGDPNQPPSYPGQWNQPPSYPSGQVQPPLYPMPSFPAPGGYAPEKPLERPATLQNAVRLMVVGAVVSAISLVFSLLTFNSQMSEATTRLKNVPKVTPEMINTVHSIALVTAIFSGVVGILVWLWMAWMNHQGRKWARIVATVLAALSLFSAPVSWAQSSANGMELNAGQVILPLVTVVIGVVAAVLIWLRPSSEYYAFRTRQRRSLR